MVRCLLDRVFVCSPFWIGTLYLTSIVLSNSQLYPTAKPLPYVGFHVIYSPCVIALDCLLLSIPSLSCYYCHKGLVLLFPQPFRASHCITSALLCWQTIVSFTCTHLSLYYFGSRLYASEYYSDQIPLSCMWWLRHLRHKTFCTLNKIWFS